MVDAAYGPLEWVRSFVDDAGLAHEGERGVAEDFQRFLTHTHKYKLKLKPSNTFIGFERLEFLGHELSKERLGMVESKMVAIRNFATPKKHQ